MPARTRRGETTAATEPTETQTPDPTDASEAVEATPDESGTEATSAESTSAEDAPAEETMGREPRVSRETARGSAPVSHLEREGDIAADYLEGLLDIADLDGDIDMDVEGDRALVSIVGGDIEHLVGDHGQVLDALQELTRLAVTRETGERSRLMLDVAGHREARRQALTALGTEAATRASSTGEPSLSGITRTM